MKSLIESSNILHRDEAAEKRIAAEIDEMHSNVQDAVDAFNAIGLKPLQPEELNYYLHGGHVWIENRWKEEQEIPPGWPKNYNREKFIEGLERPDFSKAVEAVKVNMVHRELFRLEDDKVVINDEIKDQLINRETIFLDADEQMKLAKLETVFELLDDLGMLQTHPADSLKIALIDLNNTGYAFNRFPEETGIKFDVRPHTLKKFLSTMSTATTRAGIYSSPDVSPTRNGNKVDFLRRQSMKKFTERSDGKFTTAKR